ncbi:FATTY ACID EXPORT 2 protein [Nymphaea thermarum]|nr:FATTY ACID EXPORT 2 protein [Nymphaea thermarum]
MDRTFLFLGGLRDEFESIRSQILNCDEIPGIEDVYACVESEEQRRQVMQIDPSRGSGPSAFVSRSSVPGQRPARRCTHCNKPGHSVDFCWDLHPEKRLVRGRPPSSRHGPLVQDSNPGGSSSGDKSRLSQDQIKELQAYIGRLSTTSEDSSTSDGAKRGHGPWPPISALVDKLGKTDPQDLIFLPGGVVGFLKRGSKTSLAAGGVSALLLFYVYTQLPTNLVFASSVGLGVSATLLGVMGSHFKKTGKMFPAGVVSIVSFIMTGGYIHGILRSMHA